MTTDRCRRLATGDRLARSLAAASIMAALLLASCGATVRRPDGLDRAALPESVRSAYGIFEVRCSRCHSLARPLNADIDDPAYWADYVRRMRRQPGSGISHDDAARILEFLRYYTTARQQREREGEPPPSTPPSSRQLEEAPVVARRAGGHTP